MTLGSDDNHYTLPISLLLPRDHVEDCGRSFALLSPKRTLMACLNSSVSERVMVEMNSQWPLFKDCHGRLKVCEKRQS